LTFRDQPLAHAAPTDRERRGTTRGADRVPIGLPLTLVVLLAALGVGYVAAAWSAPTLHNQKLPWIAGRGLGIAAYLTLAVGVALGLWLRHPWRHRLPMLSPAACLRLHLTVVAAAAATTGTHVAAVVLDKYAHVGASGALLPGRSAYRPFAVGLGTLGLYGMVLVGGTALLAGRLLGGSWLPIHRTATVALALIWAHGVLTGSDVEALRPIYVISGLFVVFLAISRRLARDPIARGVKGSVEGRAISR
jgi:hypothetical protein